ncbi:MAG TPA: Kiwa anti-phage protein KwaB-like domain-containing protein [Thermoplasmataceae archaeon]|nr:Kiwa anti-phage protein KwaB-like domain-containing protein [Thermoplasmataceae archaeon]
MVVTLEGLKKKLSELANKDERNEMTGEASLDYVLEYNDQNNPFQTFSLNTERDVQELIITEVEKRIRKLKEENAIEFDFTKELGREQIGVIELSNCPERLTKMISASNQPNRNSFRLSKDNKNKVIAYITTISKVGDNGTSHVKIIKKLNLASILSRNKKKAAIGLIEGTVKGMSKDVVLFSPESFDLVVMNDTAFVMDERNFHFLFSGTQYLKSVIEGNKNKLDSIFDGYDNLIHYAERNPSALRGLYHILTRNNGIKLDKEKVKSIEEKIKKQKRSDDTIFEYSNGKIVCTEKNSNYVYWLLSKRYGLNILDDEIFVSGSQYPIK